MKENWISKQAIVYGQKAMATAALFLTVCHPTVHAQSDAPFPNYAPSNMQAILTARISSLTVQGIVERNAKHGGGSSRPVAGSRKKFSEPAVGAASTSYSASPAITEKAKTGFIGWARKQSPAEAEKLKALFTQYNPVTIWSGLVKEDGLKTGDAADAFAAYWILNYLIATQGKDVAPGQAQAVRAQVRPIMAKNPTFAGLTNAQKQELSETWMINFVVQQGAYATAMKNGDTEMLRKLGDAAAARFQKEMQIDLRGMTLTDKGFAPKKS